MYCLEIYKHPVLLFLIAKWVHYFRHLSISYASKPKYMISLSTGYSVMTITSGYTVMTITSGYKVMTILSGYTVMTITQGYTIHTIHSAHKLHIELMYSKCVYNNIALSMHVHVCVCDMWYICVMCECVCVYGNAHVPTINCKPSDEMHTK